jgi:hypothetical protein
MKGIATVILLLLLSVQTFSKWMWVLDYNLNQAYIANNLCINKAKPKLHCNGHCQLRKKMAEDESSKEQSGSAVQKSIAYSVFSKPDMEAPLETVPTASMQPQSFYLFPPCNAVIPAIFHPPSV